jgi:hypothetical protein
LFVVCGVAQAQTFTYNQGQGQFGDVLVCFRPVSGAYDLVVDAGPVTAFTALANGQHITVNPTYYNGSQLAFIGTNNIFFSAMACQRLPGSHATNNLWLTRPRANVNTQSTPWPCKGGPAQASAAATVDTIGVDGENISGLGGNGNNTSPGSSTSYVIEPEGNPANSSFYSYSQVDTANGNLGGNFWGDAGGVSIEQSTPANFTTGNLPVRADFYQLLSTNTIANPTNNQASKYLGYFELSTAGVLVYTAGPATTILTQPRIVAITRKQTTNTIFFTTLSGPTYTLRYTNNAGLMKANETNWISINSLAGNGLTNSLQDVTTSSNRFYVITAQ